MQRLINIIRAIARLVGLYGQRVIRVLQVMLIHFEEIAAITEQRHEQLTDELRQVLEVIDLIDDMIEQAKAEIFEK